MTDRICISSQGKENYHISAEDLTSCCWTCGMGCNGGFPESAWLVLIPLFSDYFPSIESYTCVEKWGSCLGSMGEKWVNLG